MSFTFPDPSVTTTATNPDTGITYEYADGMWTPAATVDERQDTEIDELESGETLDRTAILNLARRINANEDDIEDFQDLDLSNALSALATAKQDIIELKSKVNTLELTSFLIME